MVSSTDHVTPVTGLSPTVVISKNGGSFASPSGAVTEIGNGWYAIAGNATDRNTLGELLIHATGTGADPVDDRYMITAYNPFDSVRLGLTALPDAAANAAGGLPISDAGGLDLDAKLAHTEEVTAARMGALTDWIDGGRLDLLLDALLTRLTAARAGYLDNLSAAPPSASDIATAVWAAGTRTLSSFGTLVADVATSVWGAVARTITGGTITTNSDKTGYALTGTDIADIKSVTVKLDTAMELDGAVYRFTTNALEEAPSSSGGDATADNQTIIINHLTDIKGATFSGSTDSLEAIRNRGDVAWITGGTGGGSNAVTINVKDDSAVNVVDCYVEIWDSAGTSFISRTNTNSSGNVTFNLDSNTYIVKMHKTGYYFANQTLVVNGTESEAYTGTILTPDAATDPTLCRIYGYYFDPAGATYSAVKSLIKLTAIYEASDNNYYTSELVGTYNTTTGLLYFDVIQGASVTLEIPILNVKKSFVVPAQTLYKISDIA